MTDFWLGASENIETMTLGDRESYLYNSVQVNLIITWEWSIC